MTATVELVGPGAVVTSVSKGIGCAIAVELARAGANVAGVYRSDDDGADAVRSEIESEGREAMIVRGDTGDPALARRLADEDWHGLLAADLRGYFYGSRAAPQATYPQGRGRIINITSATDVLAVKELGVYIAAKGGILGLTRTLALESARHGVTVNALSPGATDTPLDSKAYTPQVRATYE